MPLSSYRYDRFARSLRQLVNALAEFDALGIHFISLHEGVDTSTPNGRLVFGIFASIAEFERELIRDRVRSGLVAAKAKGWEREPFAVPLKRPPKTCPLRLPQVIVKSGLLSPYFGPPNSGVFGDADPEHRQIGSVTR
jgi:DNA invertase Pin-like site-specific DNA recombinase